MAKREDNLFLQTAPLIDEVMNAEDSEERLCKLCQKTFANK